MLKIWKPLIIVIAIALLLTACDPVNWSWNSRTDNAQNALTIAKDAATATAIAQQANNLLNGIPLSPTPTMLVVPTMTPTVFQAPVYSPTPIIWTPTAQPTNTTEPTDTPVATAISVAMPLNSEGHPGPTTAEAKKALGLDVQRDNTEPSSFVWRSSPQTATANCPIGWICTLTLADNSIKLFVGDGQSRAITAGTFRYVAAYASNDAVNNPCQLLKNEQDFGAKEIPSFTVTAGNFSCE